MFRYRIAYCAALSAAILFFIFFKEYLSFFTLIFVLLLPFMSWLFLLPAVLKTTVRLKMESPLGKKNEGFHLYVRIKNDSFLPIARVQLRLSCANALSGEIQSETLFLPVNAKTEQIAEFGMQSPYCGKVTVKLTQIRFYDYLGILSIKQNSSIQTEIFISPNIHYLDTKIDTSASDSMESSTYSKRKPGDDPSEIFDIRPYRSGDRLHSIHWKLSSRLDELMVKEFSLPADSNVLLFVELLAPDMAVTDALIEVFVSLSHFLSENQIRHRIEWYNVRTKRFDGVSIDGDEDLAALLNVMLSSGYYTDEPYALNYRGKAENAQSYPHAIYITGKLTEALAEFCDRPGSERSAVLLVGDKMDDEQRKLADSLNDMNAAVRNVLPDKIQESLEDFIL